MLLQSYYNRAVRRGNRTTPIRSPDYPVFYSRLVRGLRSIVRRPGRGHDRHALHTAVVDSLREQIAVIDRRGIIVDVNRAWRDFGNDNGLCLPGSWEGMNYLRVLDEAAERGDDQAREIRKGVLEVIRGQTLSFQAEYPCHSPDEQRWFMMRMTRLEGNSPGWFVISHHDITLRKLAEERAEALAMEDELTGLANRRSFNLFLESEARRSRRDGTPLSAVLIDVDHFKQYNDEFGHAVGDECLVGVGRILRDAARRPGDLAVRLGGDEFALILPNTTAAGSEKIGDAVLAAINKLDISAAPAKNLTASMGIASVVYDDRRRDDFVLNEADRAMYYAKQAGRNRMVHAEQLTEKPA